VLARCLLFVLLSMMLSASAALAQTDVAAKPIVGLRDNRPRDFALQHATVVVAPGQTIEDATVLISGSSITAVGTDIEVPAGSMAIDCTDKQIYPGLIDAYSEFDVPPPVTEAGHWNEYVTPHRSAASVAWKAIEKADKLRDQGITLRLVAPKDGIVKGTSAVVLLGGESAGRTLLKETAWQHLQLTVPRGSNRAKYPNSPMGAVALLRQSMYDANWYREAWSAYSADTSLPRPETNIALDHLSSAIEGQVFVVDAPNERMAIRAGRIADEFSLKMMIRGSGREYRQLDQIIALNRPILLPVNFSKPPDVSTGEKARNTTLQDLMHWDLAPANPGDLVESGVTVCLTTDGLDDPGTFLSQVRKAIDRGLKPDDALAALTTVPADLLEIDDQVGRIQPGMLANLVVTDGDLFEKETKVLETWVAGEQFVITPDASSAYAQWIGTWSCEADSVSFVLELTSKKQKISGTARAKEDSEETVSIESIGHQRDRLTATIALHEIDPSYPRGISRLSLQSVTKDDTTERFATITFPDGTTSLLGLASVEIAETEAEQQSEQQEADADQESEAGQESAPEPESDQSPSEPPAEPTPVLFPLGGFGLQQSVAKPESVLFRGATVWTCGPHGVLEGADLLVRDGLIAEVGQALRVPEGCQIIDARGKHITPGLIDCHSHIASDGGINESAQAVTAEVRIGDFIDNTTISIYRQLAGGTTTANILHGSANPIGGQNQVIKFRWGETMDALRMKQAPAGIKFALGENVKRNQSRYPNTRMGVEQIIRDQLLAAREYQAKWKRWRNGQRNSLPPRRDLQLDAIAEIQNGERWIHCHSYRQDEIVATLDVLEEFGVQIGTLQHILEGYKVADRMKRHGAMGSSFSDWWAYKFEVFDAIPYNGALMHEQGIVVSFNSDDSELGRRLNVEAAKAMKYGDVSEADALKFVTLNPAKQLRIDPYVGSLEAGKHADLVLWNGRPLSPLSRCEQSWIDGRQYFSLETDRRLRARDRQLRASLIQKVLACDEKPEKEDEEVDEEDRWFRHDIFCGAHGGAEYDQRRQR
jgi:N-acetylglucosamine-6-phosphate deacetylase